MISTDHLRPAYGRGYDIQSHALSDWKNGFDFQNKLTGQYCSIRDYSGTKGWLENPVLEQAYPVPFTLLLPRGK